MVKLSPASDKICDCSIDKDKRISFRLLHNSLCLSFFLSLFLSSGAWLICVCLNFFTFIVCSLEAVLVKTAFLELHRE